MSEKRFSLAARLRSFRYAFAGIYLIVRSQHNAYIHLLATILVIAAGFCLQISIIHWILIVIAIVLVWMAEALNTAIEFLCDVTSPDFDPLVQKAKDVAAGAVLITAIGAVVIGSLVFIPALLSFFKP